MHLHLHCEEHCLISPFSIHPLISFLSNSHSLSIYNLHSQALGLSSPISSILHASMTLLQFSYPSDTTRYPAMQYHAPVIRSLSLSSTSTHHNIHYAAHHSQPSHPAEKWPSLPSSGYKHRQAGRQAGRQAKTIKERKRKRGYHRIDFYRS
ncbi:hypothetical protein DL98DRAFT_218844 [Cadophora sp. DSE1049]|nr:hypothetical protein DL98DRAFT_218844 [Cadophora sp. DSE1049]